MAKNQLDKLFQSKLKNHEISPSPQAWEKLEFLLDEKAGQTTRRKGFFWISIAAAVSLLLVSSLVLWQYNQKGNVNDLADKANQENKLKDNKPSDSSENAYEYAQKNKAQEKVNNAQELENIKSKNNSQSIDNQANTLEKKQENQWVNLPKNQKENQNKINDLNKNRVENKKQEMPDNQLIKENKEETAIAQNNQNKNTEGKSYTIKVTAKLNSQNKVSETALAQNTEKRKGVRGVIQNIRDIKNGEKELKLFGTEADKVLASLGKE